LRTIRAFFSVHASGFWTKLSRLIYGAYQEMKCRLNMVPFMSLCVKNYSTDKEPVKTTNVLIVGYAPLHPAFLLFAGF
jgi:hypothetical protein